MMEQSLGVYHWNTNHCRDDLAEVYFAQGSYAQAREHFVLLQKAYQEQLVPGHADTKRVAERLRVLAQSDD